MRVVVSQSMLFPWVGLLEQLRLADVFVHYDDVQFSKGSFVNRVQIKTASGVRWMTIPTRDLHLGQRICEVEVAPPSKWLNQHLALLKSSLAGGVFKPSDFHGIASSSSLPSTRHVALPEPDQAKRSPTFRSSVPAPEWLITKS